MKPFTIEALAERWECNHQVIRKLIDKGDLKSFRVGAKLIRISTDEVERYEKEGPWQPMATSTSQGSTGGISPDGRTKEVSGNAARLARMISKSHEPHLSSSNVCSLLPLQENP